MAGTTQIPRSRGSFSGLCLILLGAWGALIPLFGPYLKYGYDPNQTWDLTQNRLYLSVIPGGVVLLAGLVILMTRSRTLGGFFAFVAVLAGSWFIAGAAVLQLLPASIGGSITPGRPIATTTSGIIVTRLGFFTGAGMLILFFAAAALGRFSIAAHKDHLRFAGDLAGVAGVAGLAGAGALAYDAYQSGQAQPAQPYQAGQAQFPLGQDTFPSAPDQYPGAADQYPATQTLQGGQDKFPATHDPTQAGQGLYPGQQFPAATDRPTAPGGFPGEQDPFQPSP